MSRYLSLTAPRWRVSIVVWFWSLFVDGYMLSSAAQYQRSRCAWVDVWHRVFQIGAVVVVAAPAGYGAWRCLLHMNSGDRPQLVRCVLVILVAAAAGTAVAELVILAGDVPPTRRCAD